jgi:hypothetical protein
MRSFMLFKLLINVQINRFEVGGIYNALSVKKHKFSSENLTGRNHLGDKSVDRMEMLCYNLETEHKA